jgi:hypothetical protein
MVETIGKTKGKITHGVYSSLDKDLETMPSSIRIMTRVRFSLSMSGK